ncbi:MAG: leucine-rich repeat domain-containing protein [Thermoguttaceae bacterium]|nr:leucine-rich repeat domain-containing protein [Thermoguttaceae bacterium]
MVRLESIDNAAFFCCRSLESVELPPGLRKLGARAFANCLNLKSVVLPASLAEIEPDAFAETDDALTLYVESGSAAEQYARDAGLRFTAR